MSVPTTDLRPHLALVTGASGGIGRATCNALASMGCSVAVHYHSSKDVATALVEELKKTGVRSEAFKADLTKYDEVRALHASVVEKMGNPTRLTLKSGIKPITEISIDEFEHIWCANCGSAFLMTQLCLPAMEKAEWGKVFEICFTWPGSLVAGAYSKAGITVNGIAPALIRGTTMLPGSDGELAKKIPIGRLGFPEEIAETVMWMVKTGYVINKVVGGAAKSNSY